MSLNDTPILPFHFTWRSGESCQTLAGALVMLEQDADSAAWHFEQGHLHDACQAQGYLVLVDGLPSDAEALPQLIERIRIALEMHRNQWDTEVRDELSDAASRLGRIFQRRGAELVEESRKRWGSFRNWLADAIRQDQRGD